MLEKRAKMREKRANVAGNRTHSKAEKGAEDYQTPPECLEALMRKLALPERIWEPMVGLGNLKTVLEASGRLVAVDDINPAYAAMHGKMPRDFLTIEPLPSAVPTVGPDKLRVQMLLTNPPFSMIGPIVLRGLAMGLDVVLLGRLNLLEGGERDPHRDQIMDRGGLDTIYVLRERPRGMHRTGWEGPKTSPQMTLAWYHWRPNFKGKAKVVRISQKSDRPLLAPRLPGKSRRDRFTIDMFPRGSP